MTISSQEGRIVFMFLPPAVCPLSYILLQRTTDHGQLTSPACIFS